MPRKKKKTTIVKVLRCPEPGCRLFFPNLQELFDHLDYSQHCETCGFTSAQSAQDIIATDIFCPSCRLETMRFPKERTKIS